MMRGKPMGSHCRMGSFPPGAPLAPYPGFSASKRALAQGVIGGMSLSGAMGAAPISPSSCHTPDRLRFGAGAGADDDADFAAVCCGAAWAAAVAAGKMNIAAEKPNKKYNGQ